MSVATAADVRLSGRVVDENGSPVPGAQVSLRLAAAGPEAARLQAIAGPTGNFTLEIQAAGDYTVSVEREGFFRIESRPVLLGEGANEITLVLNPSREVFEKVDVAYSPPAVDFERTVPEQRLSGTEILEIPYPSSSTLRKALRTMPGVVEDSLGGIHLNGGTEEQILYTLDGFQINDPLTGRFETRLSVESVRTLEMTPITNAEFGKGASGSLAIKTSTGDDRFRYSGTNFLPAIENRKGLTFGAWTPRFNVSGPIRRSRAWFSDGFDIQYDQNVVEDLPKGQDRTTSWRFGNLLRNQVNLTQANTVFTSFLVNVWTAPRTGLSALDPPETTVDRRSRQWFFSAKDQWSFARGALLEAGFAINRTFGREIPQGHELLVITPDGRRGNSFVDAIRSAGRDQMLVNVFLPSFTWLGGHQIKAGFDLDTVNYWQNARRSGYVFLRADSVPSRRVMFGGNGMVHRSNSEASSYIQDSWKPRPSVLIEAGVRQDWDRILDRVSFSPRFGVAWVPIGLEATKLSASYGVIYEEPSLRLFSRPLDQYAMTTYFAPDGSIASGPRRSIYEIGPGALAPPRSTNWTAGVEQRFPAGLYARIQYSGRRGHDGLTYVNTSGPGIPPSLDGISGIGPPPSGSAYRLRNLRKDVYDGVEFAVRQTFRRQYEWLASYTRARAFSNAVVDLSVDDPVLVSNNVGRMPWDTPNRFLSWAYLPTPWENWAVAYLLEVRNGYPFSIQDDQGMILGRVNDYRYPAFFELNLHMERRFTFHGHRWAFRFGFNNITGHRNPNVVINDITSPRFLSFYGGQSRALNFRLRWLGKS